MRKKKAISTPKRKLHRLEAQFLFTNHQTAAEHLKQPYSPPTELAFSNLHSQFSLKRSQRKKPQPYFKQSTGQRSNTKQALHGLFGHVGIRPMDLWTDFILNEKTKGFFEGEYGKPFKTLVFHLACLLETRNAQGQIHFADIIRALHKSGVSHSSISTQATSITSSQ